MYRLQMELEAKRQDKEQQER